VFQVRYGALEQALVKKRTESDEDFAFRQSIPRPMRIIHLSHGLYAELENNPALRTIEIHEYVFSDYAAVGAAALADGIDYFLDWWIQLSMRLPRYRQQPVSCRITTGLRPRFARLWVCTDLVLFAALVKHGYLIG